ncbi:hypothetical protein BDF22DRAFT_684118 [Syncephalis plumigaleata]|nr:hypothetical protein BDF22DRAFT_684118 [Syncephalis plumigaleata]
MASDIQQKLARYETFVNDRLKPDLQQTLSLRDQELDSLTTMVDLGCNFYAQAKVLWFHLQLTLQEANQFIERKIKHLHRMSESYTEEAARIRAHIKTMLHAMAEILQLDQSPSTATSTATATRSTSRHVA